MLCNFIYFVYGDKLDFPRMKKECYYLPVEGDDTKIINYVFSFLLNPAKESECWVATCTNENFKNISDFDLEGPKKIETETSIGFRGLKLFKIIQYSFNYRLDRR